MANAILGADLCPSIFDPTDGNFLVGGQIFFYASDGVTLKNIYDSPTREQTLPNPYTLDSIAKLPLIYYDVDDNYVIEIREAPDPLCPGCPGDLIYPPFEYFPPGVSRGSSAGEVYNYIPNGTFLHPIKFFNNSTSPNLVTTEITEICAGWQLEAIGVSPSSGLSVFIENLHDDNIQGNPYNQSRVQSLLIDESLSEIDLKCNIGNINVLQSEPVTISFLCSASIGAGELLSIVLHRDLGNQTTDDVILGTVIVPSERERVVLNVVMPSEFSGEIDPINARTYFKIRFPNDKIFDISITAVQIEVGTILDPFYIEQPLSLSDSKIIGDIFSFPQDVYNTLAGQDQFVRFLYTSNVIHPYLETGNVRLHVSSAQLPADVLVCDGSSLDIDGYSLSGIPHRRLYNVIGDTFGSTGSLSVSNQDNVVTFTSVSLGNELSAYLPGTTNFTVIRTNKAYKLGIIATYVSPTQIDIQWTDNFDVGNSIGPVSTFYTILTPGGVSPTRDIDVDINSVPRYIGSAFSTSISVTDGVPRDVYTGNNGITVTNTQAGSLVQPAKCTLTFNSNFLKTDAVGPTLYPLGDQAILGPASWLVYGNYLQFNSVDRIASGNNFSSVNTDQQFSPSASAMHILFRYDGQLGSHINGAEQTLIVDFSSQNSWQQNLENFVRSVNNPFEYQVTVTEVPAPSQYFLFSTTVAEEYFWFFLTDGGGGVDPALPGRIGTQINIASTDTLTEIAQNIAEAIRDFNFSLPTQADLPARPNPNFVWVMSL